jgi:superfamily II DNA/RNA helicase
MLFLTATPHSGKADVFRSLLSFLKPSFANLPDDLSGPQNEANRQHVAQYLVQRRRGDIKKYLEVKTTFPARETLEISWKANQLGQQLFSDILGLVRDNIERSKNASKFQQRITWWSALSLLRAASSSPAALAATLRNRCGGLDFPDSLEMVDELGRRSVFDLTEMESVDELDTVPGADDTELVGNENTRNEYQQNLAKLAKNADTLTGESDIKLLWDIKATQKLLDAGFSPILFCRFIHTSDYLAQHLRQSLKGAEVASITGMLPPEERKFRIEQLSRYPKRVLVCTDCLSEGINLQDNFNAVLHYDLSWNPTRHEQREGRVDRFGQPSPTVRVVTYYGVDNPIDSMVLKVLLRKHEAIRKDLGVSVPIPEKSEDIIQTMLEKMLLTYEKPTATKAYLPGLEQFVDKQAKQLSEEWDKVVLREEKRSNTMFAQARIKPDQVANELYGANQGAGDAETVKNFTLNALKKLGASIKENQSSDQTYYKLEFTDIERRIKNHLDLPESLKVTFSLPAPHGCIYLGRTHPTIERLATMVMNSALDPIEKSIASRAGTMRTTAVSIRTTLLICRFRYLLKTLRKGREVHFSLTEECGLLSFSGAPEQAVWLDSESTLALLEAKPTGHITSEQSSNFIKIVTSNLDKLLPYIRDYKNKRANNLLKSHENVRDTSKSTGLQYEVRPQGTPDIIGIYIYLPE